jgi:nickel-dependent lactate racemase
VSVAPAKALIVAPGGRGYDGTLSQAIRLLWNVIDVVKKSGEILLVSECRDGVGSEALQMVVTGRISGEALKKGTYADGAEEISYVNRLKQDYSITLLSSLPELYSGTRMRFRTATSGADAINKVLNSTGRNTKFHVVSRLGETIVSRTQ